jgi:hypothetical protein
VSLQAIRIHAASLGVAVHRETIYSVCLNTTALQDTFLLGMRLVIILECITIVERRTNVAKQLHSTMDTETPVLRSEQSYHMIAERVNVTRCRRTVVSESNVSQIQILRTHTMAR